MDAEEIKALIASTTASAVSEAITTFRGEFGESVGNHTRTSAAAAQAEHSAQIEALKAEFAEQLAALKQPAATPESDDTAAALKHTELQAAEAKIKQLHASIDAMKHQNTQIQQEAADRAHSDAILRQLSRHGMDPQMSDIALSTLKKMSRVDPANPSKYIMEIPGKNDTFGVPETFHLEEGISAWAQGPVGSRLVPAPSQGSGPNTTPGNAFAAPQGNAPAINLGDFSIGGEDALLASIGNVLLNN